MQLYNTDNITQLSEQELETDIIEITLKWKGFAQSQLVSLSQRDALIGCWLGAKQPIRAEK